MAVTAKQLVDLCLSQAGDRYIFGHEVKASDSNPSAFDCSELVEWACARLGVKPTVPDGSWYQARHCKPISVAKALTTPGALLFRFSSDPFKGGRPKSAHVAISQGNAVRVCSHPPSAKHAEQCFAGGKTIEARGTKYGVGQFSAVSRGWTHAGLIPGIDYSMPSTPQVLPKEGDMPLTKAEIEQIADASARAAAKAVWAARPGGEDEPTPWQVQIRTLAGVGDLRKRSLPELKAIAKEVNDELSRRLAQ